MAGSRAQHAARRQGFAREHSDGAADEIVVEDLATACTDAQVLGGDGLGGVECQADVDTDDQNLFQTIDTSSGTDPVADSPTDTVQFAGTAPITVTGSEGPPDSVTIACTNAVADGSTKGCASFDADQFDASSGNIKLGDPGVSTDQIFYWDESSTDWEVRDPTTDFTEDGTNFGLNASVTEMGATIGDGEEIQFGTNPTVNADGYIGIDETQDQWLYYSDDGTEVLDPIRDHCFTIEMLKSTDDGFLMWVAPFAVTIEQAWCVCDTNYGDCDNSEGDTLPTLTLEDTSGNAMTGTITCEEYADNPTEQTISGSDSLVQFEGLAFDVTNTPTDSDDKYTICWTYKITRQ